MRISDWSSDVCSSDLSSCGNVAVGRIAPLVRHLLHESRETSAQVECIDVMDLTEVSLTSLRVFRAVAEQGTFTAAAAALGSTHSRSEERRVGKACGSPCRSRWSSYP